MVSQQTQQHQTQQQQRSQRLVALLQHYQLERDPFSDTGMRGLFFAGGDRKNVVDALLHFSRYGTAPLFLSAPAGFGKTTILNEFAIRVDSDIDCAVITADMLLGSARLYQNILQGFAVPVRGQGEGEGEGEGEGDGMEVFTAWLREQSLRNRQVVLCLDDAQNLERDIVQALVALAGNSELAFKLVFAGQPDARLMLENAVERQGMLFNSLDLTELSRAQVGEYVQYRLEAVGYRGDFPLTSMQVQAAALRSRGSIAQLNELVRDLLIAGLDSRRARAAWKFPLSNLFIAGLLAGVTLYFGWRSLEVETHTASAPITLEKVPRAVASTQPTIAPADTVAPADKVPPRVEDAHAGRQTATRLPASVAIARAANDTVPATQNITDDVAIEPAASDATPAAGGARDSTIEPIVEPIAEVPAGQTGRRVEPRLADPAPAQHGSRRVYQRLQAWPDEGYALQVFGTHNEQRAKKLVEQYFGEADLLFYETRHNGKPWFVVINGPYSGRQTAQESIVTLPESLRRLRPWPRNVASIKGDISRFDELLGVAP